MNCNHRRLAMDKFQPGDVVVLKSGGPVMTVEKYGDFLGGERPEYKCVWFEKNKKHESIFAEDLLESADDD